MKADEIRAIPVIGNETEIEGQAQHVAVALHVQSNVFLREIAAQLADLSERLRSGVTATVTTEGQDWLEVRIRQ